MPDMKTLKVQFDADRLALERRILNMPHWPCNRYEADDYRRDCDDLRRDVLALADRMAASARNLTMAAMSEGIHEALAGIVEGGKP